MELNRKDNAEMLDSQLEIFEKAMDQASEVLGADPAYFGNEGQQEFERQLAKLDCRLGDLKGEAGV